jgi:3',5'-nucleoside bisphosphate phosphatase
VHSTASDGSYTAPELVELALGAGLTALAIADHDTVAAVPAGVQAAAGRLTFLPAVEISTHHGYQELHILGYMLDLDCRPLLDVLEHIQEERVKRARRTVELLQGLGVDLGYEEVAALAEGGSVGRPHIAEALVNAGAVSSQSAAFDRYLKRGRPAYVDRFRVSPARAIELIREADGLPVLAHPKLVKRDSLVTELVQVGLGGLEVYHAQHTPYDVDRYTRMADKLHLIKTGGTDSHGPRGSYPVAVGSVATPDECALSLVAWKARRNLTREDRSP